MKISNARYRTLARSVGFMLTLMGLGGVATFAALIVTGVNPLAGSALGGGGLVVLVLASVGAYQLPLGLSLFQDDGATSARLRIAAAALGLMATLRLVGFLDPGIRVEAGIVPLVEFFVLGGIGALAFFIRREGESPIELHVDETLEATAADVWHALGERFGDVDRISRGVRLSTLEGDLGVGAVRTCQTEPFGPFDSAEITEELVEFSHDEMRFTYVAGGELPRFIPSSKNRWSLERLEDGRCRVVGHASVDLVWWALPMASLLGWSIRGEVGRFVEDLRSYVEGPVELAHARAA